MSEMNNLRAIRLRQAVVAEDVQCALDARSITEDDIDDKQESARFRCERISQQ